MCDLPKEMLVQIIQYIPMKFIYRDIMKVSNQWLSAAKMISINIRTCLYDQNKLQTLANCSNLNISSLRLNDNKMGSICCELIGESSSFRNLSELWLCGQDLGDSVYHLSKNSFLSNVTRLNFRSSKITDQGVSYMAYSHTFRNVTELMLENNIITADGCKAIAHMSKLTLLHLSSNAIKRKGLEYLIRSRSLNAITSLHLNSCGLDDETTEYLSMFSKLNTLCLLRNNITHVGMKNLATMSSLSVLYLDYNKLSDEGMKILTSNASFKNLVVLSLDGNDIGDNGARYLAESCILSLLTQVSLAYNSITDAGAMMLARSERLNSLSMIDLKKNRVTDEKALESLCSKMSFV